MGKNILSLEKKRRKWKRAKRDIEIIFYKANCRHIYINIYMPEDFFSSWHKVLSYLFLCTFLAALVLLLLCLSSFFIHPLLFGENQDNFSGDSCEPTALVPRTTTTTDINNLPRDWVMILYTHEHTTKTNGGPTGSLISKQKFHGSNGKAGCVCAEKKDSQWWGRGKNQRYFVFVWLKVQQLLFAIF